jgi:acetyl esterase/lipase
MIEKGEITMCFVVAMLRTLRSTALLPVLVAAVASAWVAADARAASPDVQKLPLWSGRAPVGNGKVEAGNAFITFYPASKPNGTAVVICPGGGYGFLCSGPEGRGIAEWLNRHGIAGIVLEYRLPNGRPFVPLLDAQRAIRAVRCSATKWKIDPDRVGIIGFSAGGHLAATAGTHFDDVVKVAGRPSCRPDFVILIYPVITMGEKTHGGSKSNLLGRNPKPELVKLFSNEKQVTEKTPPMFLAHAKDDIVVTSDNSRMMYEALKAHKVAAKYLELPSGGHGLNGYKGPMWDAWQSASLKWLAEQKIIPAGDVAAER